MYWINTFNKLTKRELHHPIIKLIPEKFLFSPEINATLCKNLAHKHVYFEICFVFCRRYELRGTRAVPPLNAHIKKENFRELVVQVVALFHFRRALDNICLSFFFYLQWKFDKWNVVWAKTTWHCASIPHIGVHILIIIYLLLLFFSFDSK